MFLQTNSPIRKALAGISIVLVLAPALFLASPTPAQATAGPTPAPDGEEATAVKDWWFDFAATVAVKILINRLTLRVVNWIRGGDFWPEGGIEAFFLDAANQVTGAFIDELGLGFLCGPWDFDVRLAIATRRPYRLEAECTLADVVANMERFTQSFNEAGWDGFVHISVTRTNNPYAAYAHAQSELAYRVGKQREEKSDELMIGRGFLAHTQEGECTVEAGTGREVCEPDRVVTPGSMVAETAAFSSLSPMRQAEVADSIDESIGIITGELINQLLTQGLAGTDTSSASEQNDQLSRDLATQQLEREESNTLAHLERVTRHAEDVSNAADNAGYQTGLARFSTNTEPLLSDISGFAVDVIEEADSVQAIIAAQQQIPDPAEREFVESTAEQRTAVRARISTTRQAFQSVREIINSFELSDTTITPNADQERIEEVRGNLADQAASAEARSRMESATTVDEIAQLIISNALSHIDTGLALLDQAEGEMDRVDRLVGEMNQHAGGEGTVSDPEVFETVQSFTQAFIPLLSGDPITGITDGVQDFVEQLAEAISGGIGGGGGSGPDLNPFN